MLNPQRTHPATLTTQSLQCPSAIGHRTTLRSTQQIILCRIQTYFQQTRCRIIFPSKNMSLVNSLCIRGGALNQVPINITLNIKPNKRHHLTELFDAGQTVQSTIIINLYINSPPVPKHHWNQKGHNGFTKAASPLHSK